jgi:septal ring factor EnvC (AmiA/AmiB activator)
MSDEAADARAYLDYFTMNARKRKLARVSEETNVFNITVGQLREELRAFQEQRAGRDASGAAVRRSQTEIARRVAAEQRAEAASRVADRRQSRARQPATRTSPYAPRRQSRQYSRPAVFITPWGGIGLRRGPGEY